MQINLQDINREQFSVKEKEIQGKKYYLVNPLPDNSAVWDKDNLIYRSSIWDEEGKAVSLSFLKFFNFGEKEGLIKTPSDLSGSCIVEKLDGSTCCVSKFGGRVFWRTRGTFDAEEAYGSEDFDFFREKYPEIEKQASEDYSLLFEMYQPTNRIVLDYGKEPKIWLIGKIYHEDYRMEKQKELDYLASTLSVPRPITFSFDSLEILKESVKAFEDKEGVCMYFNDGQDIKKIKGDRYLFLHKLRSEISSIENLIDIYQKSGVNSSCFLDYFESKYDFEIRKLIEKDWSLIQKAENELKDKLFQAKAFIHQIRNFGNRALQAKAIQDKFGKDSSFAFSALDNKANYSEDKWAKMILNKIKEKNKKDKEVVLSV